MDEKDRVRFTALQRRKLQRFEDIVDDLEDLVTDGSPSSAELEARQGVIAEFREDGRRLNASFAGGTPSVVAEDPRRPCSASSSTSRTRSKARPRA